MKKILRILFLLLILNSSLIFSQNFMPMHVGDNYHVHDDNYWYDPSYPGGYASWNEYDITHLIIKDSLINKKLFYLFENMGVSWAHILKDGYYHLDSVNQNLYVMFPPDSVIRLAVDFNTPKDSLFFSYINSDHSTEMTSGGIIDTVLFGTNGKFFSMHYTDTLSYVIRSEEFHFFENMGLVYRKEWERLTWGYYSEHVNRLVSITPTILEIDSLYPTRDRGINEFPFTLYADFRATEPTEIDSFYLLYELTRNDSLVSNGLKFIYLSSASVTLHLPNIEIDDELRLKAVIIDNHNVQMKDVYPDSGWITINVLPPVTEVEDEQILPGKISLSQNYPNPFNPTTKISWQSPIGSHQSLKVYDVLGNEVATLVDEYKPAGSYDVEFNASLLTSGIYFYQLKAGNYIETKKMILLK